ncbi:MAG: LPS export ABC transporter permease LptF [Candidatus Binatia bacterium]|nr:MAG: LPS export ABC transporter permease LptF [Candidatus Binatia bacterium]
MGKTLARYFRRELLSAFALGVGAFTLVLLLARILKVVDLLVNRGVSARQVLSVLSLLFPVFLELTLPMALLLAVVSTFCRLSSDGEIVALKAAGVSLVGMTLPALRFAVVCGLATGVLSWSLSPWARREMHRALYEIASTNLTAALREGTFYDDIPGFVVYAEEIAPPGNRLRGVVLVDDRKAGERHVFFAREGFLLRDAGKRRVLLRLEDGWVESGRPALGKFEETTFTTYETWISLDSGTPAASNRDPKALSASELGRAIVAGESGRSALVEWHRRASLPFACLAFVLVGVPLGIRTARGVRSHAFSVVLGLVLVYYLLWTAGQDLARKGWGPAWVGVWFADLSFLLAGALFLFSANRELFLRARPIAFGAVGRRTEGAVSPGWS